MLWIKAKHLHFGLIVPEVSGCVQMKLCKPKLCCHVELSE